MKIKPAIIWASIYWRGRPMGWRLSPVKLHELVNLICDQPASWSAVVILEVVIGEEGDQGLVRYYFTILLTKS